MRRVWTYHCLITSPKIHMSESYTTRMQCKNYPPSPYHICNMLERFAWLSWIGSVKVQPIDHTPFTIQNDKQSNEIWYWSWGFNTRRSLWFLWQEACYLFLWSEIKSMGFCRTWGLFSLGTKWLLESPWLVHSKSNLGQTRVRSSHCQLLLW